MSKLSRILAIGPGRIRHHLRSVLWRHILSCPGFQVGEGALILGDRHIRLGARFRAGRGLWMEAVTIYGPQTFCPELRVGERFSASDCVHIACAFDVSIGDDVLVGSKVHITDHNHGLYQGDVGVSSPQDPPATRPLHGAPVRIGHRVFLADGVVVLPGSEIGDGAIIAANSVVRGRLAPDTIYAGVPARPVKCYDTTTNTWIRTN
jgi:acetyltransferase-like isoleucine patch superfamily enzyme